MKKRGTISRCCCGDGGGTGPCVDVCEDNYNSCTPSNIGRAFFDEATARSDCGWFNAAIGFNAALNPGRDGTFTVAGQFCNCFKSFSFDYRVNSGVDFSVDLLATDDGFGGSATASATSWGANVLVYADFALVTSGTASVNVVGNQTFKTFRIVNTISSSVGTVVNQDGNCVERVNVNGQVYVDGVLAVEGSYIWPFVGKDCFTDVNIRLRGSGGAFFSSAAFSKNCTINYA